MTGSVYQQTPQYVNAQDGSLITFAPELTTLVTQISKNIFLYDVQNVPSGTMGFGFSSGLMTSLAQNSITPWLIELGNVTNLTFAGSTAANTGP